MPVEKISGRARRRRKKRAKNQARMDERVAMLVAIRMQLGHIPYWVTGKPNHYIRKYVDNNCQPLDWEWR